MDGIYHKNLKKDHYWMTFKVPDFIEWMGVVCAGRVSRKSDGISPSLVPLTPHPHRSAHWSCLV